MKAIELEEKRKQLEKSKESKIKNIVKSNKEKAEEKANEMYFDGTYNEIYEECIKDAENPRLSEYQKELIDSLNINKNGTISVNQLKVGNAFLNEYGIINNEKFFYKYDKNKGIWEKATKQTLRSIITRDLEEICNYWSDSVSRSLSNYVFDRTYGNITGDTFDQVFNKDPYMVVFKNGTLNIKTGVFHEGFHKEDYNTITINHCYYDSYDIGNPYKTINFLKMITDNDEELRFIFEWIGFLLVKEYSIAKMLFLTGDGGNGKSTLIKLMTAVVGADNTSTVSMKSLINNRFQSALLYNKLFNTVADIGADFFDDSSILKALTGDDHITIERKGENGFSYLNFAKMTYSCNKLPRFKDTTGGLQRRPIVLLLNKDFTKLVQESGLHINDIINDEEEMEKVVAYSIRMFRYVLASNNQFTESEAMKQAKEEWLNDDPLTDFIGEVYTITGDPTDIIQMADFMRLYKAYCIERGYKPTSQKNVIENIKANKILHDKNILVKRLTGSKRYKIEGIKAEYTHLNEVPYGTDIIFKS